MKNKMSKLYGVALLAVLAVPFTAMTIKAQTGNWVMGYFPTWELGNGYNSNPPLSAVDFTSMTVVAEFGFNPQSNGSIDTASTGFNSQGSWMLVNAAHKAGTKVIMSIGGWNTASGFEGAASSTNLNTFVNGIVNIVKKYGFDGVDLDWEPMGSGDYAAFTSLTKAVRAALPSPYLLTVASGSGQSALIAPIYSYFDQVNLMTYDLSGNWQGWVSWHNSALYEYGTAATNGGEATASVDPVVQSFLSAGVPANKLGIGAEFSGTIWYGVNAPNQSGSTSYSADVPLYWSDGSGIMQKYYSAQNRVWDSQAQVPYLSNTSNNTFISYDDSASIAAKSNYIKSNGIGGLILYELGWGYPGNGTYPLLAAVKVNLLGGTIQSSPSISITSPTNGSTVSGTIPLSANASDVLGIASVTFKVDGNIVGTSLAIAPFTVSLNTTTLTNGSHTISATAVSLSNLSATVSVTVTVSNAVASKDTIPPTVSITSPANNSTVSRTVSITANASDNVGVASIQFKADGTNLGNAVTSSPYTISWNTAGYTNGTHTISAVASDAAGNTAASSETIVVSNSSASAGDLWIYQNSLQSGWSDGSWGLSAATNFSSNQNVYPGSTKSIKVVQGSGGALRFLSGGWNNLIPIDPSQYTSVSFVIYSTYSLKLHVYLMNNAGVINDVNYGSLPSSQWSSITVPFSTLAPSNQTFTMLVIQDESGQAVSYFIDNVRLVGFPAPTLVSPANGTTNVASPVSLTWNTVTSAVSYHVQVSANQSFSPTVKDTTVSAASVSVGGLLYSTTYYWRAAANSSSQTSQWSSVWNFTTASAPVVSSSITTYDDSLNSPWFDASWGATLNFSNTSPVYSGSSYSISVANGSWGAASFHYGAWNSGQYLDPAKFASVQFAVNSTVNSTFYVGLESDAGTSFTAINAGTVTAGKWTVISVSMSSLNPSNQPFNRIDIMEESGTSVTYYLDNVQLTNKSQSQVATGVHNSANKPTTLLLGQNYPNPFNPTTNIAFTLPEAARVTLKVYNSLGQEVTTLVDGNMDAGTHSVVWDGSRLASGVYFYRMQAGNQVFMKKMLLVK